jgi:hypothetical protein
VRDDNAVAPTSNPVSAPSRTPSSSPTPTDPVVRMRLSIRQQVDAGHLNPTRAPDLYKKVDEIIHAANDGHADEVAKKVQEFRDKLTELHQSGTLTTVGYERLNSDLDRLAESLR